MRRVAVYGRVSTDDGRQSLESQLGIVRDHAKRAGWEIVKEYTDETSGTTTTRPGLDALLADAHKRRFDMVLVFRLDRLGRSVAHLVNVLAEFRALGIDFASATEPIDTTTPSGQLMLHLLAAFAQFERAVIVERVRSGLARAKREGKKLGRPRAQVDAAKVRKLRADGLSIREIATAMNIPPTRVYKSLSANEAENREPAEESKG